MFVIVRFMDWQLSISWSMLALEVIIGMLVYGCMLIILRAEIIGKAVWLMKH